MFHELLAVILNVCPFCLKFMRTNIPDVLAAGDVASFPLSIREDKRVQIGHWQLAQAHGNSAQQVTAQIVSEE